MKLHSGIRRFRSAIVAIVLLALVSGCASRYRIALYMTVEEDRRQIKVESTQLVFDAVIGNPYADNKLDVGIGYVAVATTGTRLAGEKEGRWLGFSSDEYLKCQLYMEVPPEDDPSSVVLAGNTLVHLLGRYELPVEERVFLPKEGFYSLDSIDDKSLYFSVDGIFANKSGELIKFDGNVKIDGKF